MLNRDGHKLRLSASEHGTRLSMRRSSMLNRNFRAFVREEKDGGECMVIAGGRCTYNSTCSDGDRFGLPACAQIVTSFAHPDYSQQ